MSSFQDRYLRGVEFELLLKAHYKTMGMQLRKLAKDEDPSYIEGLTPEERCLPDFELEAEPNKWIPLEAKSTPLCCYETFCNYPSHTLINWWDGTKIRSSFKMFIEYRGPFEGNKKGSGKPFIILQ